MGFFRRHYREIIEAEKNRKDSDESWDWVQKSQWELGLGSENPVSCYLHHGPPAFHMWKKRIFSRFSGGLTLFSFVVVVWMTLEVTEKTLSGFHWSRWEKPLADGSAETEREISWNGCGYCVNTSRQLQPSGRCWKSKKSIFYKMYSILYRRRELQEMFSKHWWLKSGRYSWCYGAFQMKTNCTSLSAVHPQRTQSKGPSFGKLLLLWSVCMTDFKHFWWSFIQWWHFGDLTMHFWTSKYCL